MRIFRTRADACRAIERAHAVHEQDLAREVLI